MNTSLENITFKVTIEVAKDSGYSDRPILARATMEDCGVAPNLEALELKLLEIIASATDRVRKQLGITVEIKKLEERRRLEISHE